MSTESEIEAFEQSALVKLPAAYREFLLNEQEEAFLFDGDFHWDLALLAGESSARARKPRLDQQPPRTLQSPYEFRGQQVPFHEAARLVARILFAEGRPVSCSRNSLPAPGDPSADPAQFADSICLAERPFVGWLLFHQPDTRVVRCLNVNSEDAHVMIYPPQQGDPSTECDFTELMRRRAFFLEEKRRKQEEASARRAARAAKPPKPAAGPAAGPVAQFARRTGLQLPPSYAAFLQTWPGGSVTDKKKWKWNLYSLDELSAQAPGCKLDGRTLRNFESMRFFARLAVEAVGEEPMDVSGTRNSLLPGEIAPALCIGEINGDPLFLDPAGGDRLLVLHHDGMELAQVAKSFGSWIKACKLDPNR